MDDSTTTDVNEAARSRLAEERTRLEGVRSGLDDDHLSDQTEQDSLSELSSVDQHQADMGTETFEREKDLSILEAIEAELADVEHALRRLDEGTYRPSTTTASRPCPPPACVDTTRNGPRWLPGPLSPRASELSC